MSDLSLQRVHVRDARVADANTLAELRYALRSAVRVTSEPRDAFVARCATWMVERLGPESRWRCWIAELDGAPIGCVWVQPVEKLPNPNGIAEANAYLSTFFVVEGFRGQGVGSVLLAAALTWCDAHGIAIIFLWPTQESRPLYTRHGFTAEGGIMERSRG